jgi:hypothetical protein
MRYIYSTNSEQHKIRTALPVTSISDSLVSNNRGETQRAELACGTISSRLLRIPHHLLHLAQLARTAARIRTGLTMGAQLSQ